MRLLGIDVPPSMRDAWCSYLAPAVQPFFVTEDERRALPAGADGTLTPDLRDTYKAWGIDRSLAQVWLDEQTFLSLPRETRARLVRSQIAHRRGAVPAVKAWSEVLPADVLRAQADGHRFVWWPSLLEQHADEVLTRIVADQHPNSRHDDVEETTWQRCADAFPGVRALAGTFPRSSGANCFGTVLAAAGAADADDDSIVREPFEAWLSERTRPAGRGNQIGTVFVWRDRKGLAEHAAVCIGDGWVFEKPSQEWFSPRWVLPVAEQIASRRYPGSRLERHRLIAAP